MTTKQLEKVLTSIGFNISSTTPFTMHGVNIILDSAEIVYSDKNSTRFLFDTTNELLTVYRGQVVTKKSANSDSTAKHFVTSSKYIIDFSKIIGLNIGKQEDFLE